MNAPSRVESGFTLVELMVTIVIAATLLSVAVPSYLQQVRKSRRTEAKTAILDLAGREERLYSTTNSYSADPTTLGYAAFGQPIGNGYYRLDVSAPPPVGAAPATFTITATALNAQAKDTQCLKFIVDQTGKQSSLDNNNNDSSTTCLN